MPPVPLYIRWPYLHQKISAMYCVHIALQNILEVDTGTGLVVREGLRCNYTQKLIIYIQHKYNVKTCTYAISAMELHS